MSATAPLLIDAVVAFGCEVENVIERYGRALVVGRVKAVRINGSAAALVLWRGAFEQLGWSPDEIANAVGLASRSWPPPRSDGPSAAPVRRSALRRLAER